jgi:hypothetical protein
VVDGGRSEVVDRRLLASADLLRLVCLRVCFVYKHTFGSSAETLAPHPEFALPSFDDTQVEGS